MKINQARLRFSESLWSNSHSKKQHMVIQNALCSVLFCFVYRRNM